MWFSKSRARREIHGNTSLLQESREIPNKQPNFTPKAARKRTEKKKYMLKETHHKNQSRNKWKGNEGDYRKNQQTKRWFWEDKQNRQTISQPMKNKREKNQINKIRRENGEIIADKTEIQKIIRDYYEQ